SPGRTTLGSDAAWLYACCAFCIFWQSSADMTCPGDMAKIPAGMLTSFAQSMGGAAAAGFEVAALLWPHNPANKDECSFAGWASLGAAPAAACSVAPCATAPTALLNCATSGPTRSCPSAAALPVSDSAFVGFSEPTATSR